VTIEQRIGRFRLERALGTGAFSTVWLAHDDDLDDLVALKILADNWSRSDDARRRFVEEARALRRLDGDRIVRVYELAELRDGRPYLVMEYADRGSLEDRMRFAKQADRPFSASEVAALGIELAGCLASVHAGRFVHRDVKPSNVLFRTVAPEAQDALRRTGRPAPSERMLLGDFGIARRMEMAGLTQIVGSPQYMAPEQSDASTAHRVDARADLYSAGVVLYELLAGAPPGAHREAGVVDLDAVANDPFADAPGRSEPIADVRRFRSDVPATLAHAITRAMARDPDDRYATAWELRQDLVRSLGEPASASPPPVPRPVATPGAPPVPRPVTTPRVPATIRAAAPAASAPLAVATTGVVTPASRTDVLPGSRPGPAAPLAPRRPDAPPQAKLGAPAQAASSAPQVATLRLGALDTCVFAAVGGIILVIAAILPWRSASGTGSVSGIDLRAGTLAFAAGGALVLAAVIRWAARGKWGLRVARVLADLAGLTALAAVVDEIVSSRNALTAIFDHGIHARLGIGVGLTLFGSVVAFVAAGRAKRQLRDARFSSPASRPPSAGPTAPAATGPSPVTSGPRPQD
jgi:serine/threonine protein kinase